MGIVIGIPLRKAGGPFIGPRGGKWADAKHTIPWKDVGPLLRQLRAVGGSRAELLAGHLQRGTVKPAHVRQWLAKQPKAAAAPSASKEMTREEWGVGKTLTTLRIGSPKGGAGTFFGDRIKGWEGQRNKPWSRELPTEGADVLVLRGGPKGGLTESTGDAAGAPLGSRIWDGTLDVPANLRAQAGDQHHSNIDRADAVAALALKQKGYNVVHIVNPQTKATVSIDLRDHTEAELAERVLDAQPVIPHEEWEDMPDEVAHSFAAGADSFMSWAREGGMRGLDPKTAPAQEIPLTGALIATQDSVSRGAVKQMMQSGKFGSDKSLPLVVEDGSGKRYIVDGTHRLDAQIRAGRKNARVRLVRVADTIAKARYLRRWRGKGGRWEYEYPEDHPRHPVAAAARKKAKQTRGKVKPPGSQLPADVRARLKELGVTKLPEAVVPVADIKLSLGQRGVHSRAVIVWRDTAGRQQSGYTPTFHERNAKKKWDRVIAFRPKVPALKRKLTRDIAKLPHGSPEHQGAVVAAVVAATGLRPGSMLSVDMHGHYGVTTLTAEHLTFDGDKTSFSFVGKSGKHNTATIRNKAVTTALKEYVRKAKHGRGKAWMKDQILNPAAALAEARAHLPGGMKLKDLRTVIATEAAEKALKKVTPPPPLTGDKKKDKRLLVKAIKEASTEVSEVLNNTPAVAKSTYIHPMVFEQWARKTAGVSARFWREIMG